jgi:hypothetical protein
MYALLLFNTVHHDDLPLEYLTDRPGIDWPYCGVARRMVQMAAGNQDLSSWNGFQWRRKMEAFGDNDEAIVATGAGGEIEAIWFVISQPRQP